MNELKDLEPFSIRIPGSLKTQLKIHCAQKKVVMQDFVAKAIQEKLKKEK